MNSDKKWKYFLFFLGFLIVAITLLYSNFLVRKLAIEERNKVELWAKAIKKKSELVAYTQTLFKELSNEEKKKVELWSTATRKIISQSGSIDYSFLLKVISDNTTVPVILAKANGEIISHRNLDKELSKDKHWLADQLKEFKGQKPPIVIPLFNQEKQYLYYKDSKLFSELKIVFEDLMQSFISEIALNSANVPTIFYNHSLDSLIAYGNLSETAMLDSTFVRKEIRQMQSENLPIEIQLDADQKQVIYYKDSSLLRQLKYFPVIQILVFALFILFAYWLFSSFKASEQNRIWAGMAKETAHQLGTPISSLIAWNEHLEGKIEDSIRAEIQKDTDRLNVVAQRFSKIGSDPQMVKVNIGALVDELSVYFKKRIPRTIELDVLKLNSELEINANATLLEWAIENIIKNAIDCLDGKGKIDIRLHELSDKVTIEIQDTGKGIDQKNLQSVFQTGFTTKQRGWGIGLALTKRIVEQYHKGKVYVKSSKLNIGTTFAIELPKV